MATIELVYDKECPNVSATRANLIRALAEAKADLRWIEWERSASDAPERVRGFASPTVLVNGRDVAGRQPMGGLASCRLYQCSDGRLSGVPPVETIVGALQRAKPLCGSSVSVGPAWKRSLPSGAATLFALLPKVACPACWPAYAGLLSALGVGFLLSTTYLLPLTAAFLLLAVGALALQALRTCKYGPLALGLAASAFVLAGKFALQSSLALYAGVGVLIGASLWSAWLGRAPAPACCAGGAARTHLKQEKNL